MKVGVSKRDSYSRQVAVEERWNHTEPIASAVCDIDIIQVKTMSFKLEM